MHPLRVLGGPLDQPVWERAPWRSRDSDADEAWEGASYQNGDHLHHLTTNRCKYQTRSQWKHYGYDNGDELDGWEQKTGWIKRNSGLWLIVVIQVFTCPLISGWYCGQFVHDLRISYGIVHESLSANRNLLSWRQNSFSRLYAVTIGNGGLSIYRIRTGIKNNWFQMIHFFSTRIKLWALNYRPRCNRLITPGVQSCVEFESHMTSQYTICGFQLLKWKLRQVWFLWLWFEHYCFTKCCPPA